MCCHPSASPQDDNTKEDYGRIRQLGSLARTRPFDRTNIRGNVGEAIKQLQCPKGSAPGVPGGLIPQTEKHLPSRTLWLSSDYVTLIWQMVRASHPCSCCRLSNIFGGCTR